MSGAHLAAVLMLLLVINILVMILTAFFRGYGTKKGKNLATKEDLQNVLIQVKAVTRSTEEIKTELSELTWSKQRQWDMKRDAALDVMKIFGEMEQLLNHIFHIRNPDTIAKSLVNPEMQKKHIQSYEDALKQYLEAIRKFWQARETIGLVFSESVSRQMDAVQNALALLAALLGDDSPTGPAAKAAQRDILRREQKLVTDALRKELGIQMSEA
jgi:hypothetical protein